MADIKDNHGLSQEVETSATPEKSTFCSHKHSELSKKTTDKLNEMHEGAVQLLSQSEIQEEPVAILNITESPESKMDYIKTSFEPSQEEVPSTSNRKSTNRLFSFLKAVNKFDVLPKKTTKKPKGVHKEMVEILSQNEIKQEEDIEIVKIPEEMDGLKDFIGLHLKKGKFSSSGKSTTCPFSFLPKSVKKTKIVQEKTREKPKGVHREVIELLKLSQLSQEEKKDILEIAETPDQRDSCYKKEKFAPKVEEELPKVLQKSRRWIWTPFIHETRKDNLMFYHWTPEENINKEYRFTKSNKRRKSNEEPYLFRAEYRKRHKEQLDRLYKKTPEQQVLVPSYTDEEYELHLRSDSWTRAETDHLFDLAQRFNLRFMVMCDRWNLEQFIKRSIEDIKARYYEVRNILIQIGKINEEPYVFDEEYEKRRKEQLERFYNKTREQIAEENYLKHEFEKILARRQREEEVLREMQLRQECQPETVENVNTIANSCQSTERQKTTANYLLKRKGHIRRASKIQKAKHRNNVVVLKCHEIVFPEIEDNIYFQSEKLKLPGHIHPMQRRAIEKVLVSHDVDLDPMPTDDICFHFTELLKDVVLQIELKTALEALKCELEALQKMYESLNPGKTLNIPLALLENTENTCETARHKLYSDLTRLPVITTG